MLGERDDVQTSDITLSPPNHRKKPQPRPKPDRELQRVAEGLVAHFETPKGARELMLIQAAVATFKKTDELEEAPPVYIPEVPELPTTPPPSEEATRCTSGDAVIEF